MGSLEDMQRFINLCREAAQKFAAGNTILEIAGSFGWEEKVTRKRVAIGNFPDTIVESIFSNPQWTVTYLERLVALRKSPEGHRINLLPSDYRLTVDVDYTDIARAVELVNNGSIKSRDELQEYITKCRESQPRSYSELSKTDQYQLLLEKARRQARREIHEQQQLSISQIIMTAKQKSAASATLRMNVIYQLIAYASVEDITMLLNDLQSESITLERLYNDLRMATSHLLVINEGN